MTTEWNVDRARMMVELETCADETTEELAHRLMLEALLDLIDGPRNLPDPSWLATLMRLKARIDG